MKHKQPLFEERNNLDFLDTSSENASEEMILEYLTSILADIHIKEQEVKQLKKLHISAES